jgi:DNA-binding NarL/FixJ family response regulator
LWHPAFKSDYGPFITVLAPYDGKMLRLEEGLLGGTKDTFLTDKEDFTVSEAGKFMKLSSSYGDYVGIMKETNILGDYVPEEKATGTDVTGWMLCILTPESNYTNYMRSLRVKWMLILLIVIVVCFVTSIVLSRKYVNPVISGMEALKGDGEGGKTGYSEIDELIEFMKSQSEDEKIIEEKLPENVAILFDRFAENIKKLSPAEWTVMDLYIKGHEIAEVPELAFISMATVRKHNRNIYEKLEVASRDEMMLYIDLFRRADRLDELKSPAEEEKEEDIEEDTNGDSIEKDTKE